MEDELEPCYVAIWAAISDSATARRLEAQIKEAISQRDQRLKREANKLRKTKAKTKRELGYQESARKREAEFYKVSLKPQLFDDGNGTEGEHISQI